jgi:hypothetical protein
MNSLVSAVNKAAAIEDGTKCCVAIISVAVMLMTPLGMLADDGDHATKISDPDFIRLDP